MPTLTLQPDATDGKDDDIYVDLGTSHNDIYLNGPIRWLTSNYRTRIQFDLSSIPAGSAISSGLLTYYGPAYNNGTSETQYIHRATEAWAEGVYSDTAYNAGATDSDTHNPGTATSVVFTTTGDVALFVGGTSNNGWVVLKVDNELVYWYPFSSDNATASFRPKLVIEYTLPAQSFVRSPMWGRFN